jgi:hypothetical protein
MITTYSEIHPFQSSTHSMTRKQFLLRSGLLAGGVAGVGLVSPSGSGAAEKQSGGSRSRPSGEPKPIPGGFDGAFNPVPSNPLVHVLPPAIGFEMSTISDFNGVVGAMEARGFAHGSDGSHYWFDVDMRFMKGVYVDTDGRLQEHAFGFI